MMCHVGDAHFADGALRLAGQAGVLLGWRPQEFWDATPAELWAVLAALAGEDAPAMSVADAATLARLKEQFPDG